MCAWGHQNAVFRLHFRLDISLNAWQWESARFVPAHEPRNKSRNRIRKTTNSASAILGTGGFSNWPLILGLYTEIHLNSSHSCSAPTGPQKKWSRCMKIGSMGKKPGYLTQRIDNWILRKTGHSCWPLLEFFHRILDPFMWGRGFEDESWNWNIHSPLKSKGTNHKHCI